MKPYLIFLVLIPVSLAGFSQPFHGGIMAGFTAAQVDGDSHAGFNKLGFQGGVFVSALLTQTLEARLEIRYAGRGALNPASEDNTGFYKLSLHYIDLPLLAAVKIKKIGSIEVGLIPGYMFAAQGEDDGGELPDEYLVDFHKFDLGTLLGVGIQISKKISLNFRYSYSILSIRDLESAGAYYSWFGKLFGYSTGDYNNYLSFGVNYLIR
jgi:hypothetical protein